MAFNSYATNLVAGGGGYYHVFVRDTQNQTTELVSVSSAGIPANASTITRPSLSNNGRLIAFDTFATNLLASGHSPGQVFVHDRVADTTEMVSVNDAGDEANFWTVFSSISKDGRFVAFGSLGNNLVPMDSNGGAEIFLRDRLKSSTTRISLSQTDEQLGVSEANFPVISADARYVIFSSDGIGTLTTDVPDANGLYIRAIPKPHIDSVIPNMLPIGATTPVSISGAYFALGSTPFINGTVSNVVVVDENTITADFFVPASESAGAKNVIVDVPGTGPGVGKGTKAGCQNCITFF